VADPEYEPQSSSPSDSDSDVECISESDLELTESAERAVHKSNEANESSQSQLRLLQNRSDDVECISECDLESTESAEHAIHKSNEANESSGSQMRLLQNRTDDVECIGECDLESTESVERSAHKSNEANGSSGSQMHLLQKRSVTAGRKNVYDKVHFCTFCGARICSKISRHILNVHVTETAVQEIRCLPKQSKRRRVLLQKLVNEGNFKHNVSTVQHGVGEIVVGRRSTLSSKTATDYVACGFCKRWQSRKNLWRHGKTCSVRMQYYAAHPEEGSTKRTRIASVKRGQSLVNNAVFKNNDSCLIDLMSRMRDDEVKQIVQSDTLIRREAGLRMTALGRKQDQKQDDVYRVSQAARTLGRIVLLARQSKPGVDFDGIIRPENFDLVVDIGKRMSTDRDKPSLNVGRTIGHLLMKVCDSKYCASLRNNDDAGKNDSTNFKKLVETEWNVRVNRAAVRQMESEKRMKLAVLPVTEDLQLFRNYLVKNIAEFSGLLKRPSAKPADWVFLAKCVMCRLILFNKRRRAEVRELKVQEYIERPQWNNAAAGEMALALSPVDQLLARRWVTGCVSLGE